MNLFTRFRQAPACLLSLLAALIVCGLMLGGKAFADDKAPKAKLVFTAKNGNVTFDHAAHIKRDKDCKVCHDKLFEQSATAPLNYKPAMHKTAEAGKTSCGFCHHAEGNAFESKANCGKCHVKS